MIYKITMLYICGWVARGKGGGGGGGHVYDRRDTLCRAAQCIKYFIMDRQGETR